MNGIDIYEGDNIQDWNKVKASGIEVVIQKATQGISKIDSF
jgi:lysozyme